MHNTETGPLGRTTVDKDGTPIDGLSYNVEQRKPKPGMRLQEAHAHGIDLRASWMIGDILHDVEAGNRAGCPRPARRRHADR